MSDNISSTPAKIAISVKSSVINSSYESYSWTPAIVRTHWIITAATKEHVEPHRIATGTAIRIVGPRNRNGESGRHVDARYPPNPFVVCMLAAEKIELEKCSSHK